MSEENEDAVMAAAMVGVINYLLDREDTVGVEDVVPESEEEVAGVNLYWFVERNGKTSEAKIGVIPERWPGQDVVGLRRPECHFIFVYTLTTHELMVIPRTVLVANGDPACGLREWLSSLDGVKCLELDKPE